MIPRIRILFWTIACFVCGSQSFAFVALHKVAASWCHYEECLHRLPDQSRRHSCTFRRQSKTASAVTSDKAKALDDNRPTGVAQRQQQQRVLVHWKGEDKEKYTFRFRHDELKAALAATSSSSIHVAFRDALCYTGSRMTSEVSRIAYNQAMQYADFTVMSDASTTAESTTTDLASIVQTVVKRCSLIHAAYEIVAETKPAVLSTPDSNKEMSDPSAFGRLAEIALSNGKLAAQLDSSMSWCVRLRDYSNDRTDRQGYRARSMTHERAALTAMTPLLRTIPGPVNLDDPDCKLYVLNGVLSSSVNNTTAATNTSLLLTRRIAVGLSRLASLNPNTRICVTTTPLCPTAAVLLCNMAHLQAHHRIWDPYAGSGTVLLAASFLFPQTVATLGTEIEPSINLSDMRADFTTRHLSPPAVWVTGDCASKRTLDAMGTVDAIVTDPPYGIREAVVTTQRSTVDTERQQQQQQRPIETLLDMIRTRRSHSKRLLRLGGRLVVWLPHRPDEQDLHADVLPHPDAVADAGLQCELYREQQLNERLSRWLVSYVCVE